MFEQNILGKKIKKYIFKKYIKRNSRRTKDVGKKRRKRHSRCHVMRRHKVRRERHSRRRVSTASGMPLPTHFFRRYFRRCEKRRHILSRRFFTFRNVFVRRSTPVSCSVNKQLDIKLLQIFGCAYFPCLRSYQTHKFNFHSDVFI